MRFRREFDWLTGQSHTRNNSRHQQRSNEPVREKATQHTHATIFWGLFDTHKLSSSFKQQLHLQPTTNNHHHHHSKFKFDYTNHGQACVCSFVGRVHWLARRVRYVAGQVGVCKQTVKVQQHSLNDLQPTLALPPPTLRSLLSHQSPVALAATLSKSLVPSKAPRPTVFGGTTMLLVSCCCRCALL